MVEADGMLVADPAAPPGLRRASLLAVPLLLALYLRTWFPQPAWPTLVVAIFGGVLLLVHARQRWKGLEAPHPVVTQEKPQPAQ